MKIYKPEDKFDFGKYKGDDIKFTYTFDPEYIQWQIINNKYFAIDINDFKDLHTFPMEVGGITDSERFGFVSVTEQGKEMKHYPFRSYIEHFFSEEYEQNYLKTPAIIKRFQFSETALSILNQK